MAVSTSPAGQAQERRRQVKGRPARPLRADAERNREAILGAARQVFAEQGLEAPLEVIALRAGVGIATLYRRFPRRDQLVAAAFIDKVGQYAQAAEQGLAVSDPWAGFTAFVERICDLQAADRGLRDVLTMELPAGAEVTRLRRRANDRVAELVARAQAAGRLRGDFAFEDLLLLLIAHAAVVHVTRQDAPGAGRRFIAILLGAFDRGEPAPLPDPPPAAAMARAMRRLAADRRCRART